MMPAAAKIAAWRANPILFVEEVFGATPDAWQAKFLAALAVSVRMALKACKGPGKTCVLAWAVWWFLVCFPFPKVVCTSVTGDNLAEGLWAELAKWQKRSPFLVAAFKWSAESIVLRSDPEDWFASARTWAKSASKEKQADTLAGIHADHVLFVIDEAGGVPDGVAAAAEGGLANISEAEGRTAKFIIAGNPTETSGPLYRACTKERHLWWVYEITADPDAPDRTPRVSREWALQQIEKYGRDSAWVLVNVFGQFPPQGFDKLIGEEACLAAARRIVAEAEYVYAPKLLGVDVARSEGRDRTVFFPRQGPVALKPRVLRTNDAMIVVGELVQLILRWKPDYVFVDAIGVGGPVVDRMRELGHKNVIPIVSSQRPDRRYKNLRAQMWEQMAEWVKKGGACLPEDGELIEELCAPRAWYNASDGSLQLEAKDEILETLGRSPDKADALANTFAIPVPMLTPEERTLRAAGLAAPRRTVSRDYNPYDRSA